MKVKSKNFKLLQIILRITYRGLGAIGGTFIITDYKWTGLIILTLAAMCNEAITIIKEEEDEEIISTVPTSNGMQSNQEIGDGC
jgi:hypothetical protein